MRREDRVLLQLRNGTGYMDGFWAAAAAGHVEQGESVYEAAAREAREEVGVTIEPVDLRPLCAMHRTHGNARPIDERVDFFFDCTHWLGEPRMAEADKAVDLQWFPLNTLPDNVVPHERRVLEALLADDLRPVVTFGF
jgi:8-oxo-dGTP pyrophosphatase MutT (NUDIX family)